MSLWSSGANRHEKPRPASFNDGHEIWVGFQYVLVCIIGWDVFYNMFCHHTLNFTFRHLRIFPARGRERAGLGSSSLCASSKRYILCITIVPSQPPDLLASRCGALLFSSFSSKIERPAIVTWAFPRPRFWDRCQLIVNFQITYVFTYWMTANVLECGLHTKTEISWPTPVWSRLTLNWLNTDRNWQNLICNMTVDQACMGCHECGCCGCCGCRGGRGCLGTQIAWLAPTFGPCEQSRSIWTLARDERCFLWLNFVIVSARALVGGLSWFYYLHTSSLCYLCLSANPLVLSEKGRSLRLGFFKYSKIKFQLFTSVLSSILTKERI